MYLKRNKIPKIWPLKRKGTKYLIRPSHGLKKAVPIVVALRNMIKLASRRKEVEKILNDGKVKINGKIVREGKLPLLLFDNLNLEKKSFKLVIKNKKFAFKEVASTEAEKKIAKVTGKKLLRGRKIQINLSDGRNYITKEKIKTGDSVIINLKENKISEILPFKKGCKIMFISGKHIGEEGSVEEIDEKKKIITLKIEEGKINGKQDSLIVIK